MMFFFQWGNAAAAAAVAGRQTDEQSLSLRAGRYSDPADRVSRGRRLAGRIVFAFGRRAVNRQRCDESPEEPSTSPVRIAPSLRPDMIFEKDRI
jgi:hypothetical protein